MKKILINFSDHHFANSQKRNTLTGLQVGGFDQVRSFKPRDIDDRFRDENQAIFAFERGAGYWLWKPYIILKTLAESYADDVLFYCDSGAHFVSSVDPIISYMIDTNQELICFDTNQPETRRTKRDAFILMNCDSLKFRSGFQRAAGFSIWRKTDMTIDLATAWLQFAQDPRILTDQPNQCGLPNYRGFREHRHDQSIFSLLCKKHDLAGHRLPAQQGNRMKKHYTNSSYRQFIRNDRIKN